MNINSVEDFNQALANGPYTFPGCYPIYFITSDGAAISFETAEKEKDLILDSIENKSNDGWQIVAMDVNWEDSNLYCDHSGELIESAYGEEE